MKDIGIADIDELEEGDTIIYNSDVYHIFAIIDLNYSEDIEERRGMSVNTKTLNIKLYLMEFLNIYDLERRKIFIVYDSFEMNDIINSFHKLYWNLYHVYRFKILLNQRLNIYKEINEEFEELLIDDESIEYKKEKICRNICNDKVNNIKTKTNLDYIFTEPRGVCIWI